MSLDLGGFTIVGPGTASGFTGVSISGDRALIRNGTIRTFQSGVSSTGDATALSDLRVMNNGRGIGLQASNALVSDCHVSGTYETGVLVRGAYSVVARCTIQDSGISGVTLGLGGSGGNNVLENSSIIRGNASGNANGAGVVVLADQNIIRANYIDGAGATVRRTGVRTANGRQRLVALGFW